MDPGVEGNGSAMYFLISTVRLIRADIPGVFDDFVEIQWNTTNLALLVRARLSQRIHILQNRKQVQGITDISWKL